MISVDAPVTAIFGWLAPIVSTLVICAGQLALNSRFKRADEKRDAARADTDAKRKAEAEWRDAVMKHMSAQDKQMTLMTSSLQSTMRASLIHNAEKYFSRGSITPEEHASWCDMHDRYSAMGFNGLIDTYRTRIDQLPHVTIDELANS